MCSRWRLAASECWKRLLFWGGGPLKEDFTIRAARRSAAANHEPEDGRRQAVDLLTGPNLLYIGTNEIGRCQCRPVHTVHRRLRSAPDCAIRIAFMPWRKPCSPNQSWISLISATWNC